MTLSKDYHAAKSRAKAQGVEWLLTFEDWLAWWGEDINRRGRAGLQMQRIDTSGPWAVWNLRKATAREDRSRSHKVSQSKRQAIDLAARERFSEACGMLLEQETKTIDSSG